MKAVSVTCGKKRKRTVITCASHRISTLASSACAAAPVFSFCLPPLPSAPAPGLPLPPPGAASSCAEPDRDLCTRSRHDCCMSTNSRKSINPDLSLSALRKMARSRERA